MRPTPETMALWGIIPTEDYFMDPHGAVKAQRNRKSKAKDKLALKYSQRSKPDELVARGLAYEKFWQDEAQDVERQRQQRLNQAKLNVAEKLNPKRRPSVTDLVATNIYPEDAQVVQELKRIAQRHHRMQSAIDDLAKQLPFEDRVAEVTASNMMKHLVTSFFSAAAQIVTTHQNQMNSNNDAKFYIVYISIFNLIVFIYVLYMFYIRFIG